MSNRDNDSWSALKRGRSFYEKGSYTEAKKSFEDALNLSIKEKDDISMANALSWLSKTACKLDELEIAAQCSVQSAEAFLRRNFSVHAAEMIENAIKIYNDLRNPGKVSELEGELARIKAGEKVILAEKEATEEALKTVAEHYEEERISKIAFESLKEFLSKELENLTKRLENGKEKEHQLPLAKKETVSSDLIEDAFKKRIRDMKVQLAEIEMDRDYFKSKYEELRRSGKMLTKLKSASTIFLVALGCFITYSIYITFQLETSAIIGIASLIWGIISVIVVQVWRQTTKEG